MREIRGIGESNRRYSFAVVEHPQRADRKTCRRDGAHEQRLRKVGGMWVVWYQKVASHQAVNIYREGDRPIMKEEDVRIDEFGE